MKKSFTLRGMVVLLSRDWWRSRDRPSLARGIPALVGGGVLLALVSFAALESPEERGLTYLMAARRAHHTGNSDAADIFYRKALQEWPDHRETLLEAAGLADERRKVTRRDAILRRLVEDGDATGLLLQAQIALREGGAEALSRADQSLKQALSGADAATRASPAFVGRLDELRRLLATAEASRWRWPQAAEHYCLLQNPSWEDRAALVESLLILGEPSRAAGELGILQRMDPDIAAAPASATDASGDGGATHGGGDASLVLRRRALLAAFAGDLRGVLQHLGQARQISQSEAAESDSKEAATLAWARTAVRISRVLRMTGDTRAVLGLLEEVVSLTPGLPLLAGELVILAGVAPGDIQPGPLDHAEVMEHLAGGRVPVVAHLIAGLQDLDQGREATSSLHLSVASDLNPSAGFVLTQCGLQLARMAGDLEDHANSALRLSEAGMGMMEETGTHWGTRLIHGHLLLSLQRWQEAIDCLEPIHPEHEDLVGPLLEAARKKRRPS